MTLPLVIALNAALDLTATLGVFAVVRFTHRLHDDTTFETAHPSRPLPIHLVLPADEVEGLAEAA